MTPVRLARRASLLPVLAIVAAGAFVLSSPPAAARSCDAATAQVTQTTAPSRLAVTLPAGFQAATAGDVSVTQGGSDPADRPVATGRPSADRRRGRRRRVGPVSGSGARPGRGGRGGPLGPPARHPRRPRRRRAPRRCSSNPWWPVRPPPGRLRPASGAEAEGRSSTPSSWPSASFHRSRGGTSTSSWSLRGRDESRATWAVISDLLSRRGIALDVLDLSAERAIPAAGAQCPAPPVAAQPLEAGHEVGAAIAQPAPPRRRRAGRRHRPAHGPAGRPEGGGDRVAAPDPARP